MASIESTFNVTDVSSPGFYGPSQTALLLLDFHSMFVERAGGAGAPPALDVAAQMRMWAKSQNIQVIHCLIDLDAKPFPTCKDAGRLTSTVAAAKESGGGAESPVLREDADDDITFTRVPGYVSALKSPGLEDFLQEKGIKSLVLTGLSTSGCVMRTAVTACDAEYVVTTISDGCADAGEGVHDLMVKKILNNRGYVMTGMEFRNGFVKAMSDKSVRVGSLHDQ